MHEFKVGKITLDEWAAALGFEIQQVDSSVTSVESLEELFVKRTLKIRGDLEQFIRGTASRVDLPPP